MREEVPFGLVVSMWRGPKAGRAAAKFLIGLKTAGCKWYWISCTVISGGNFGTEMNRLWFKWGPISGYRVSFLDINDNFSDFVKGRAFDASGALRTLLI